MAFSGEPIYDIVRGITTVVASKIVYDQFRNIWAELFTGTCQHCYGTGKLICPHCHGTNELRRYPGVVYLSKLHEGPHDPPTRGASTYECIYCGDATKYDDDSEAEDDEDDAYQIMDNLHAALTGRLVPKPFPPTAGLVECPECDGQGTYEKHIPNFDRLLGWQEPVYFRVTLRLGQRWIGAENRPKERRYQNMEWPSGPWPLTDPEVPFLPGPEGVKVVMEKELELAEEGVGEYDELVEIPEGSGLTLEDFILPYVDDGDEDSD